MNAQLVADMSQWLTSVASRRENSPGAVFDQIVSRLTEGIPLLRTSTSLLTMHPEVEALELVWRRGQGTQVRILPHSLLDTAEYQGSPVEEVVRTRVPVRCRLGTAPPPFPQLRALAEAGATDYLAVPVELGSGRISSFSFATDAPSGFDAEQVQTLEALVPLLSLRFDLGCVRHGLRSLLEVYLGKNAAQQVLTGSFRRGAGQLLSAAIWFCDLRGFTAFSDARPATEVVATLDRYFETVGGAVEAEGGEILKFIGDAMMAVFPVAEAGPGESCRKALAAASRALAGLEQLNADRSARGQDELRVGIALHLGDVMFGNIGARSRLDFTIIGHSVNEAARLESLSKELHVPLVLSGTFVRAAGMTDAKLLGMYQLRGVRAAQEVFTLASLAPGPGAEPGRR
jgi:adenylate cyclase